jgi:hypothetical protein
MNSIVYTSNFDITKVAFDTKMKSLDTGSKMKFMSYNKNPLIIQTPECYLPFGIGKTNMDDDPVSKYALDLSFRDMDSRPALKRFFDILKKMDDLIVSEAFNNQKDWFRKTYPSKDVIEALYSPIVRYSKDRDTGEITDAYPPTFKMKLPRTDDRFLCDFYDYKENKLDGDELLTMNTKGARAVTLVRCNGLWFAGGKFGCSWKAVQVLISPKVENRGCAIKLTPEDRIGQIDDDDDDDDNDEEDEQYHSDDDDAY